MKWFVTVCKYYTLWIHLVHFTIHHFRTSAQLHQEYLHLT